MMFKSVIGPSMGFPKIWCSPLKSSRLPGWTYCRCEGKERISPWPVSTYRYLSTPRNAENSPFVPTVAIDIHEAKLSNVLPGGKTANSHVRPPPFF